MESNLTVAFWSGFNSEDALGSGVDSVEAMPFTVELLNDSLGADSP